MIIKKIRALRGPNYYHKKPVIYMLLDLQELEEKPSDLVDDFRSNMEEMIPSLYNHTCSPGVKGGLFIRMERGTWAGHVAEHVALELQYLIGHEVSFGKTYTDQEKGLYTIVFRYINEAVGLAAAKMAVEITEAAYKGEKTDIAPYLAELKRIDVSTRFGPSTQAIVNEASERGIPYIRLNEGSFVQFGYGKHQKRIEASMTGSTSALGVDIAADKERPKKLLSEAGIPVSEGEAVYSFEEALEVVERIKYPVVIKPLSGNHGRAVTTNILNEERLKEAFDKAKEISSYVIIEDFLVGEDFRLLVVNGKLSAAAHKEPAAVIGDGASTISELIDQLNEDQRRGDGHDNILTKITIDEAAELILREQSLNLDDILDKDRKVYLKATANLSTGGTATDITDQVHPENIAMAERTAKIIGLDIAGIDIIAEDMSSPLRKDKEGIIEVNAGPGLRMHLNPSHGEPKNVAKDIVDMLFPKGSESIVPIVATTGTNGKTTTTNIITHLLKSDGQLIGMTSTNGVYINNHQVFEGDYSGSDGAGVVLKDPIIDCAVLEVARGGILRRGLAFNECDIGIFLNVSSDHLGLDGIESLEELTRVKSTVTEAVKKDGYAIFNAEDELALSRVDKTEGHVVYFSINSNNPLLKENLNNDNYNVTVKEGMIVVQTLEDEYEIVTVNEVPATFNGNAEYNIENVLAAVAAVYGLGLDIETISEGLKTFRTTYQQTPGRGNVVEIGDFKVMIDYGHNVDAVHATGKFFRNLKPARIIRMVSGTGDRRTEDILEYGGAIAEYADYTVITDPDNRNRTKGETADLVKRGMLEAGETTDNIEIIFDEKEAIQRTLGLAQPGDLIVLQVCDINLAVKETIMFKEAYENIQSRENA